MYLILINKRWKARLVINYTNKVFNKLVLSTRITLHVCEIFRKKKLYINDHVTWNYVVCICKVMACCGNRLRSTNRVALDKTLLIV